MRLIHFLQITFLLLSVLSLLASAGAPESAYGQALAANRPAQEKKAPRDDLGKPAPAKADEKQAGPKSDPAGSSRQSGSRANPATLDNSGKPQSATSGDHQTATPPPQPQATATERPSVPLSALSIYDPCGVSGAVRFAAPYSGTLTLRLTYHLTGEPDFTPTSSTWTSSFNGRTEADFRLPMVSPGLSEEQKPRLSSYRIEVASANPPLANMPVKSEGFNCGNVEGAPGPNPTATARPTGEATVTVTNTPTQPLPSSATPAVPPSTAVPPTAIPSESATPTMASSPSAIPTIAPSSTAIPTATAAPTGTTSLSPDGAADGDPGSEVAFSHVVRNLGTASDVKELHAASTRGWAVEFFASDGATPLEDSNQNGSTDTGPLEAGQSIIVVVRIAVPPGTIRGVRDVTIVTASSASHPGPANSSTATDTTTVNGVVALSLSTRSISFGGVSPAGSPTLSEEDASATVDDLGAFYVKSRALQVTVNSNSAWQGAVRADENLGSASSIRVEDGDLQWRLEDGTSWSVLGPTSTGFAEGAPGIRGFWYDYGLRVLWEDDPGDFSSVVSYSVTQ